MGLKKYYKKVKKNPTLKKYGKGFKENVGEIKKSGVSGTKGLTRKPEIYSKASGFKKRIDFAVGDFRREFK